MVYLLLWLTKIKPKMSLFYQQLLNMGQYIKYIHVVDLHCLKYMAMLRYPFKPSQVMCNHCIIQQLSILVYVYSVTSRVRFNR